MLPVTDLLVVYASETGTSQDIAECVWRSGVRRCLNTTLYSADEISLDLLVDMARKECESTCVLFICSTCGEGDAPTSMRQLWRTLLRRTLATTLMNGLHIAVIGLGDSSYIKFNFAAKKLYRRLEQLGATLVMNVGLADEQHELGVDSVCDTWLSQFWSTISAPNENANVTIPSKYKIYYDIENVNTEPVVVVEGDSAPTFQHPATVTLLDNKRLTPDTHWQDTRLIEIDISDTNIVYQPGDVANIYPFNLREMVDAFIDVIDIKQSDLHRPCRLTKGVCTHLPPNWLISTTSTTLHKCIERFFDIQSIPRRSFLLQLAAFAEPEQLEHEKLIELSSSVNQEDFVNYITRPRRTIVEVLLDFNQTAKRVPLHEWFNILPSIRHRSFSIASCQQTHNNRLQLLVAIVNYRTRLSVPRLGLCSNYLARLQCGDNLHIWTSNGTLNLPLQSPAPPIILIGPGTGVAPLRSYLHYLKFLQQHHHTEQESVLFYGCRNRAADFYFEDEYSNLPVMLFTAFSRDQPGNVVYVQHVIKEKMEILWPLIDKRHALIIVCGSSKQMPKDVRESLIKCAIDVGGYTMEEADKYYERLMKIGRYQMETW